MIIIYIYLNGLCLIKILRKLYSFWSYAFLTHSALPSRQQKYLNIIHVVLSFTPFGAILISLPRQNVSDIMKELSI